MITLRDKLILAAAIVIAFGGCLFAGFAFDDYSIFSDSAVTAHSGWLHVWSLGRTRPLTYLTFWLNNQLAGQAAWTYHAVNLVLHLACAVFLLDVLKRLMPAPAALLATAIFALHPMQSESVDYVFARSTLLSALFCILALRSWTRGNHWQAVAWFAVSLAAKEEWVALPIFLLLLYISISRNRAELKPIGAMVLLALIAGAHVLYATAQTPGAQAGFAAGIKPIEYLGTQGYVILRYLRLLVAPVGFTIDPQIPSTANRWAWLALIVLGAVSLKWFTRARAGFWFLAGLILLLPSSSIFPAADLAADRRMYLPMIGFASALALLLARYRTASCAICAVLLVLTITRTYVWQSESRLWTEAVERSPGKVRPKLQLARVVDPSSALQILEEAKRIAPDDPAIASELGRVYLLSGAPEKALTEFGRALALSPNNPNALTNRGVALLMMHQEAAARLDFTRALGLNPCLAEARDNAVRVGLPLPPCAHRGSMAPK
jgi:tetratricopeptide (TPR) repeat protein